MESELSTPRTRRESEVWQACDDLWAQNASTRHLTGDNIRDQLLKLGYKRGSPNEIYRYRSSWRESRGVSEHGESGEGEVKASDPISRAVSMVYDQMRTQTSEELDKITEDYETKLKAHLVEIETLKDELDVVKNEKADLAKEFAAAQQRNAQLDIALANEQREHIALAERIKGASQLNETLRAEHQALILELKTFHEREIDLWRSQVSEAQKALAELKHQTKTELERQGAQFSDELMKVKTELRQSADERALLKARAKTLEDQIGTLLKDASYHSESLSKEGEKIRNLLIELETTKLLAQNESKEKVRWQRTVERYLHGTLGKKRRSHSTEVKAPIALPRRSSKSAQTTIGKP